MQTIGGQAAPRGGAWRSGTTACALDVAPRRHAYTRHRVIRSGHTVVNTRGLGAAMQQAGSAMLQCGRRPGSPESARGAFARETLDSESSTRVER